MAAKPALAGAEHLFELITSLGSAQVYIALLPGGHVTVFMINLLTGLWVTLGAPALFAAVGRRTQATQETQGTR